MSPVIESSADKAEDDLANTYLLSYKVMVSKLNGWQLTQELARKLELYDELTDCLARPRTGSLERRETIEKNRAKVEKQIEILRERTHRNTNSNLR